MWICSRKSNQTELKDGCFSPDQQTKIRLVMCGVGKLLSLSWRHQPCSRCQQVSLMSPHPKALFPQCLCNKTPFRPVWGNAPETNKGPANPFICCWKEPGKEAYSSNPTFLFHSEVPFSSFTCSSFQGFILAEQKDHEEKKFTIPDNL